MATPTQLLQRALETVRRDGRVRSLVGKGNDHYRIGSYRELDRPLNVLPLVFATLPASYLHGRVAIGGPVAEGANPREAITYVLNIVCVSKPQGNTLDSQLAAFDIADAVQEALYANIVLADEHGGDPLAHDLEIRTMSRLMGRVGMDVEAITAMVHVLTTREP